MAAGKVRAAVMAAALAALAACDPATLSPPPAPPPPEPAPAPPSAASLALRDYYARVERDLVSQGLLRQDGGGPDTPFTARMLAENFIRIALYDEYAKVGGRLVQTTTPSYLRRWESPIRMRVVVGDSTPPEQEQALKAEVAAYAQRLSRATRLPIRQTETEGNFVVLFLNEDERRAAGPLVRSLAPGISEVAVRTITEMPRSTFCLVFALSEGTSASYTRAVAMIRTEHPDLLRRSCIHEELAQAMGLANDSPAARPSIFNDDEEFGLLTRQDELMLRILYDPRLKPGMTEAEARPIVEAIAEELAGGES